MSETASVEATEQVVPPQISGCLNDAELEGLGIKPLENIGLGRKYFEFLWNQEVAPYLNSDGTLDEQSFSEMHVDQQAFVKAAMAVNDGPHRSYPLPPEHELIRYCWWIAWNGAQNKELEGYIRTWHRMVRDLCAKYIDFAE